MKHSVQTVAEVQVLHPGGHLMQAVPLNMYPSQQAEQVSTDAQFMHPSVLQALQVVTVVTVTGAYPY